MSKTSMLFAGAVGYVLGARAGRQRYEQIVDQAQRIWTNPGVQKATRNAQDLAREKAPVVGEKLTGAAKSAASSASSAVGGRNGSSSSGGDGAVAGVAAPGTPEVEVVAVTDPLANPDGPIVT
jgi:SLT domain-containing protein